MFVLKSSSSLFTLFRSRQIVTSFHKTLGCKSLFTSLKYERANKLEIQNVTVVGGGVMGSGIAQVCAQSGFNVTVVDNDEYAQKCLLSIMKSLDAVSLHKFPHEPKSARKFITDVLGSLQTTQDLENGCKNADLVIEAVIEDVDIKKNMFQKIDGLAPPHTIFASNTSSLSIEEIGELTTRPDRFLGLHFFNPASKLRAVEVIRANKTSNETVESMLVFVRDIGKVPVTCRENPETAGFIVNSLLFPYLLEALRFLESGNASIEDIDTAMKLGAGLPNGPFELIDIIGIDDMKSVVDRWHAKYPNNPKYFPSDILNKLFSENKLGRKSGQGFYTYKPKNRLY